VVKLGRRPADPVSFERYLRQLRSYLRGEEVTRSNETRARIEWLAPSECAPVPIEIVPSGPVMLAVAGRQADRIAVAVGAAPEVVRDFIQRARSAVEVAGRDTATVDFGAYVPVVVHEDRVVARREVRRIASAFANFLHLDIPLRPESEAVALLRENVARVRRTYCHDGDPYRGSPLLGAAGAMSDEFVDWFTAAGAPESVATRLLDLHEAGAQYVHLLSGHHALPQDIRENNLTLLATEVLPALRASAPVKDNEKHLD
jgi:alkanesulfonate monooxygenase SsuD/methylene tetrahydromethanopterin reductase-like flavin-dependent oxidoreductase (luciferase family)